MLWEFVLAGLSASGLLLAFGWYALVNKADNKGNLFLVAGAILLIITGLFAATDAQGIEMQSDCVNATIESSHIWNCSTVDEYCFGKPYQNACRPYNTTQCAAVPGCDWNGNYCEGTPTWSCETLFAYGGQEKCEETRGCWMASEVNPQTCDNYTTTYTYGPCYKETVGFNFTQAFAIMLILAGIGTLLGVVGWSKQEEIYEDI